MSRNLDVIYEISLSLSLSLSLSSFIYSLFYKNITQAICCKYIEYTFVDKIRSNVPRAVKIDVARSSDKTEGPGG